MKRMFLLLVALSLAISLIAGCNSGPAPATEGDGSSSPQAAAEPGDGGGSDGRTLEGVNLDGSLPILEDPSAYPKMKMAIAIQPVSVVPPGEMTMIKKLAEDTGVEFEWETIQLNARIEKINLMLASRDLPDVFWNGLDSQMIGQYLNDEVFLPTEELTEQYMPRLKAILDSRPEYVAAATAPDGHRYGFPFIEEANGLVLTSGPFVINQAWLEACGLDMPTTVDQWVDALRAFRDAGDLNGNGKDDEIPYAFGLSAVDTFGSYNTFNHFAGTFGQSVASGGERNEDYTAVKDGKVIFTARDEAYKKTAELFHTLNEEGLIDPDSFSPHPTKTSALYLDKIKGDEAVIGSMGLWSPVNQIPNQEVMEQYAALPRLEGENGKMGFASNFSEMRASSYCAITTACEYPEIVAAFVDYLVEPEISIMVNWGPEDVVFVRGDDGKLHYDLDENNNFNLKEGYETYQELRFNHIPFIGSIVVLNEYYDQYVDPAWDAELLHEWQIVNGRPEVLAEGSIMPQLIYSVEEQRTISQIQPQVKNIVQSYTMQWILDGDVEGTWDNYLQDLENAGVEQMLEIFQTAYDRYQDTINNL